MKTSVSHHEYTCRSAGRPTRDTQESLVEYCEALKQMMEDGEISLGAKLVMRNIIEGRGTWRRLQLRISGWFKRTY